MPAHKKRCRIKVFGNRAMIYLNGAKEGIALCSPADVDRIHDTAWRIGSNGYVTGRPEGRTAINMHTVIMGRLPYGRVVDHINRNRLDNRRENLRITDYSTNRFNSSKRFHGAYFIKGERKWFASIKVNGQVVYLGRYATEAEAIAARDEADTIFFGAPLIKREVKNAEQR